MCGNVRRQAACGYAWLLCAVMVITYALFALVATAAEFCIDSMFMCLSVLVIYVTSSLKCGCGCACVLSNMRILTGGVEPIHEYMYYEQARISDSA